jgi:hypothetical protein
MRHETPRTGPATFVFVFRRERNFVGAAEKLLCFNRPEVEEFLHVLKHAKGDLGL